MRQYLHLLVVDRRRRTALTAVYGARWLLPMVYGAERARAAPLALGWAADHGVTAPARACRGTPHGGVLGMPAGCSRVCFKGLRCDRDVEPRLTAALAAMAPESFASTSALDRQAGGSLWWLWEACPGSVLARA